MPTPKRLQTEAYWDREWELEKARGKNTGPYKEREKARQLADKMGIDRKGKHVDHKTPLVKGGKTTKSNIRVVDADTNLKNAPHRGKQISNIPKLKRK
jgi:hypothetical protein